MDFMSRGNNQPAAHQGRRKHFDWAARTIRIETFIVLVGAALLLAAVSLWLALSGGVNNEFKLVDQNKYQAVFLNGGSTSGAVAYSTYFGHVTNINSRYVTLKDVYYLTTDQSSSSTNPQLIKLGCQQLHAPIDKMVVNRNQVAFWENLRDDGKVVTAIKQFIQQNPNGPNCSQATQSQTPQSSGSSQNAGSTQNNSTTNTTGH